MEIVKYNGFSILFEIIYPTAQVIGHALTGKLTAKTMNLIFHKEMFDHFSYKNIGLGLKS